MRIKNANSKEMMMVLALAALLFAQLRRGEAECVQGDCKDGYGWWEWSNGDR